MRYPLVQVAAIFAVLAFILAVLAIMSLPLWGCAI